MGKYHEKKPLKKLLKARKNEMKEAEYVPEREIDIPKRKTKKRKKTNGNADAPSRQKKGNRKKIAKNNSKAILSHTFDLNPEDYLEKSLLFNLKKD